MISIMSGILAAIFDQGTAVVVRPGQTLFRAGDRVRSLYLVVQGQVHLVRHTRTGKPLILSSAGPDRVLAEASAYSDVYHCDAIAKTQSTLRSFSVASFRELLRRSPELAEIWAAQLAKSLQNARVQSEIRTLKTVSERLDAWLADNHSLPPKGQLQDLAQILGVSREALYRELAKRRT